MSALSLGSALAIVAAVVLAVLSASGCDRSPAGTVPDEPTAAGADDAERGENHETMPCESIEDCPSYLSCIDQACQEPPAVTGRHESDTPVVRFVDDSGDKVVSFFAELAITGAEHQKGLMYRRQMQDDWGMLFIYADEGMRSFWMENTFISLDMVFIDGQGRIVNILEEVEPLTRARRKSTGPARYVLELNAGRASEAGLEPGQRMELENVAREHVAKENRPTR
jgi:uncharacterized membrane protein (UPF0127 family)